MEQLRVCLEVLCNSQEWHPTPLVSLKVLSSCGHTPSVPDPRVTLGPWLAQVHTYPVGTWNSSESAPKCFATHTNGTHLHWSAWKLWSHPQLSGSARDVGSLVGAGTHLPCGYMEQLRVCLKVLETHKNGTHLHWSAWKYLLVVVTPPVSVPDLRAMLDPWLVQVHTYPVGTWNSL